MTQKSKKHQIWSHFGGIEEIKEAHRGELWFWRRLVSTRQSPRNGIPLGLSPGIRASLALSPGILTRQHIENSFVFQGRSHRHQTLETLETSQVINLTLNWYQQTRGYTHPLANTVVLEASRAGIQLSRSTSL